MTEDCAIATIISGRCVVVDPEDAHLLEAYPWYVAGHRNTEYVITHRTIDGVDKPVRLHRLIMGEPKGKIIDHINGDGLDNRKSNLRLCTVAENCRNARRYRHSKSKYKGISPTPSGRWQAKIHVNRRQITLGRFDSEADAARAYDAAAKIHHGEFARLNFPTE